MVPHAVRRFALQHKVFRLVKDRTLGTWLNRRVGRGLKGAGPRSPGPDEPIRVAVVGAGKHANHVLIPSLEYVPELKLAAAVVRTKASLKRMRGRFDAAHARPLLTRDYREVMESPEVDAVIVTTRSSLHCDMVLDALHCGKHVFCEVPGVVVPGDVTRVRAALSPANLRDLPIVQYGYRFCFTPLYERMKDELDRFGEPGRRRWRMRYPSSLHLYSAGLHMNGPFAWVKLRKGPSESSADAGSDEAWTIEFAFRNGDEGVLEQYDYHPAGARPPVELVEVECAGEKLIAESGTALKRVRADGAEEALAEFPFDVEMPYTPERLADGSDAAREALFQRGYIPELQAFARAIRKGAASPCPLDVAVMHYRTVWALFEAAAGRGKISTDNDKR